MLQGVIYLTRAPGHLFPYINLTLQSDLRPLAKVFLHYVPFVVVEFLHSHQFANNPPIAFERMFIAVTVGIGPSPVL